MVGIVFSSSFKKDFSRIKDNLLREKILKQLSKVRDNPEIDKPMKFCRKGTRELYIKPFRLSYKFDEKESEIIVLGFYHKDEQ